MSAADSARVRTALAIFVVCACAPATDRGGRDSDAAAPTPAAEPGDGGAVYASGPRQVDDPRAPDGDIAPDSVARRMLVDVQEVDSTIRVNARYAGADNFTGERLPGYHANRALLRREAAEALARAQARLREEGYGLKVWDGYRPVRATLAMVHWAEREGRGHLLNGWIGRRSRHNLGLAVDVTLVSLETGAPLDMGTDFDTFTRAAHTAVSAGAVARNRERLVRALEEEGFSNYFREWWHFEYRAPNPLRFDMPIR